LVIIFCFIYGLLWLALVSGAGDGTWFLYSREIFSGSAPFSVLDLKQQPLFFIITAIVDKMSFGYYLLQKLLYFPLIIFFLFSVFKVSTLCTSNGYLRSIIIFFLFFSSTLFEGYRFDDYHVLAHSFVLFSLYISSLYLDKKLSFDKFTVYQALIFSLTFLTRINEGLCVLLSFSLIFIYSNKSWRELFKSALTVALIFYTILMSMLYLVCDTQLAWLKTSLLGATSSKGGSSLIEYPVKLLINTSNFFLNTNDIFLPKFLFLLIIVILIYFYLIKRFNNFIINFVFYIVLSYFVIYSLKHFYTPLLNIDLTPLSFFLAFVLAWVSLFWFFLSKIFIKKIPLFPPYLLLVIYPIFLFMLSSLSSGGRFDSLFFPASFSLLTLIIVFVRLDCKYSFALPVLVLLYSLCAFAGLEAISLRSHRPYGWHSYYSPRFFNGFKGYEVINDKNHGFFVAPKELQDLIKPVCSKVGQDKSLLSLPFSYANFYCDIKPWKGYIQTFFDTSSSAFIDGLIINLKRSPPDYIFYQRQLDNMSAHENIFFGDRALPHRELDRLIMDYINSQKWKIVYRSALYAPSDWILIQTN